jgi:cysteine synthase A
MPEGMSAERRKILKALGADIVLTPQEEGMKGAIDQALKLCEENKNAYMPHQFSNKANPEIHYNTTGPEIWEDTDGKVDMVVCGVGTGGTITGISKYIKEKKEDFKAVAIEPERSAVLSGGKPGVHKIQGIGAGFIPEILDRDLVDEVIKVTDDKAIEMTKLLAAEEGIFAGISSGAALAAAIELAKRKENIDKMIVVIIPDLGDRYLSSEVFS